MSEATLYAVCRLAARKVEVGFWTDEAICNAGPAIMAETMNAARLRWFGQHLLHLADSLDGSAPEYPARDFGIR